MGRDEHRRLVPAGRHPDQPVLPYRQQRGTFGWSKDFLEAGKQRLVGDTERQADSRQVTEMRAELERVPWACALGRQAAGGRAVAQEPCA